jgi:hypothetical protein
MTLVMLGLSLVGTIPWPWMQRISGAVRNVLLGFAFGQLGVAVATFAQHRDAKVSVAGNSITLESDVPETGLDNMVNAAMFYLAVMLTVMILWCLSLWVQRRLMRTDAVEPASSPSAS